MEKDSEIHTLGDIPKSGLFIFLDKYFFKRSLKRSKFCMFLVYPGIL